MNASFLTIANQTLRPEVLVVKGKTIIEGTLQANWITSWSIWIISGIIELLIIWNIIISWRLIKDKQALKQNG